MKIAIVGKRNAGKSTLLNSIVGAERVIVSELPGTTRDAVDVRIEDEAGSVIFVDTAGLRRPGRRSERTERGSALMTVRAVERAQLALVVTDASEGFTEQDVRVVSLVRRRGRAAVVLLNYVTLGIFNLIWFGLMHDKMPKIRHDDPSAGKAIGFMFIPFFNLYWMFFMYCRLCDRIAEQRELRGLPGESLRGLAIAACVVSLIPYVGCCVGPFIMWPIFVGMLQAKVNELVQVTQQQMAQPQAAAAPQYPGKGF